MPVARAQVPDAVTMAFLIVPWPEGDVHFVTTVLVGPGCAQGELVSVQEILSEPPALLTIIVYPVAADPLTT